MEMERERERASVYMWESCRAREVSRCERERRRKKAIRKDVRRKWEIWLAEMRARRIDRAGARGT